MTREEASIITGNLSIILDDCYSIAEYQEAKAKAIKVLEQEPCEDVISRQTVKEQMIKYGFHAPDMTVTEFVEDELPPSHSQRQKVRNKWTLSYILNQVGDYIKILSTVLIICI